MDASGYRQLDIHSAVHRSHVHPSAVVKTPQALRYTIHNKWGVMAGFEFLGDAMRFTKSLRDKWSMWDNDTGKLVLSKEKRH